jgi:hypothetical protein
MTSIINASVSSNGIVSTADASGVLKIQSNGTTTNALAWLNYNGVAQTITNSFNVSSVTYTSTGQYVMNFTNAMTNANYVPQITGNNNNARANQYGYIITQTTSALTFAMVDDQSSRVDSSIACVAVFGN